MMMAINLGYTGPKDFIFLRTACVNCLIYRKVQLTPSFHFQIYEQFTHKFEMRAFEK